MLDAEISNVLRQFFPFTFTPKMHRVSSIKIPLDIYQAVVLKDSLVVQIIFKDSSHRHFQAVASVSSFRCVFRRTLSNRNIHG